MANFEMLKTKYDAEHQKISVVDCFLPVHLTYDKQETSLYKKDGSYNEQYFRSSPTHKNDCNSCSANSSP